MSTALAENKVTKISSKDKGLEFWESVEQTNPKYTKPAKVSGQKRTAVDAQYKKKMITSKFGMYGLGWGVVAGSEVYDRVHYENQTCILNYTATAFYVWEGQKAELPIASQIKESYVTNGNNQYLKIDDEAVKKVRTDALTKAFTELGFCADIHMGMFDDQDYVKGAEIAAHIAEEEKREELAKAAYNDIKKWVNEQIESTRTLSNPSQAIKALDRVKAKAMTRCAAAKLTSKGFEQLIENEKESKNV